MHYCGQSDTNYACNYHSIEGISVSVDCFLYRIAFNCNLSHHFFLFIIINTIVWTAIKHNGFTSHFSICYNFLPLLVWIKSQFRVYTHLALPSIVKSTKNEVVNEELWNEARTYGDIQLMPFVDYYSLILWKTIAICIYGVYLIYCIIFYFI